MIHTMCLSTACPQCAALSYILECICKASLPQGEGMFEFSEIMPRALTLSARPAASSGLCMNAAVLTVTRPSRALADICVAT